MGKKMNERRRQVVQEVKERDARRRGKVLGSDVFKDGRRAEKENKKKILQERMALCCEDKYRMPEVLPLRRCPDCPKVVALTEAGSV